MQSHVKQTPHGTKPQSTKLESTEIKLKHKQKQPQTQTNKPLPQSKQ